MGCDASSRATTAAAAAAATLAAAEDEESGGAGFVPVPVPVSEAPCTLGSGWEREKGVEMDALGLGSVLSVVDKSALRRPGPRVASDSPSAVGIIGMDDSKRSKQSCAKSTKSSQGCQPKQQATTTQSYYDTTDRDQKLCSR